MSQKSSPLKMEWDSDIPISKIIYSYSGNGIQDDGFGKVVVGVVIKHR